MDQVESAHPARTRAVVIGAALLAVVGVTAPSSAASGATHSPAPLVLSDPPAPPAIRVHGQRMTFTGAVRWSGPVVVGPRTVDVLMTRDPDVSCTALAHRVVLRQTRRAVTVLIATYAAPEEAGVIPACAAPAFVPHTRRVHLDAPLAGRAVIDAADRRTHPVTAASSIPTAHGIPAPYRQQGIQVDEASGVVTRTWAPPDPNAQQRITLDRGTPAAVDALGPPAGDVVASGVDVGGARATMWHVGDTDNDITTIRWTTSTGEQEQLRVQGSPADHLSTDQVLAIARSVR